MDSRGYIDEVLDDPVAQALLAAPIPARVGYLGLDGFPRVVPMGIVRDGGALALASPTNAPKVKALQANPSVALSIDTNIPPQSVLLVRGTAAVEIVDGVPAQYLAGVHKLVDSGDKDEAWFAEFEGQVRGLYQRMALITVTPTFAKVMDFKTRIPKPVLDIVTGRATSD